MSNKRQEPEDLLCHCLNPVFPTSLESGMAFVAVNAESCSACVKLCEQHSASTHIDTHLFEKLSMRFSYASAHQGVCD